MKNTYDELKKLMIDNIAGISISDENRQWYEKGFALCLNTVIETFGAQWAKQQSDGEIENLKVEIERLKEALDSRKAIG